MVLFHISKQYCNWKMQTLHIQLLFNLIHAKFMNREHILLFSLAFHARVACLVGKSIPSSPSAACAAYEAAPKASKKGFWIGLWKRMPAAFRQAVSKDAMAKFYLQRYRRYLYRSLGEEHKCQIRLLSQLRRDLKAGEVARLFLRESGLNAFLRDVEAIVYSERIRVRQQLNERNAKLYIEFF